MTDTGTASRVAEIRAFNRFYTQVIGVLQEGLLETPYSLTEARVIFELAQRPETEVLRLRQDLRLDAGYLSRILARFEADGLITRTRSRTDGRRQVITLTAAGLDTYRELDARSDSEIATLLYKLTEEEQRQLLGAVATIRQLLGDQPRRNDISLRDLRPGDMGWVVQRNAVIYAEEYGWDQTYEALVAKIVADYVEKHEPSRERVWIAELDGDPVGCVFCVRRDEHTAQLRLLLVEPSARGWASEPSWSRNAYGSLAQLATPAWCCGPTRCWRMRDEFTSGLDSQWMRRNGITASVMILSANGGRCRCSQRVRSDHPALSRGAC